jgi:hypothetical protein
VALWQTMFGSGGGAGDTANRGDAGDAADCSGSGVQMPASQQQAEQQHRRPPAGPVKSSAEAPPGPPATVLVGHSMGGAIAVHAAALKRKQAPVQSPEPAFTCPRSAKTLRVAATAGCAPRRRVKPLLWLPAARRHSQPGGHRGDRCGGGHRHRIAALYDHRAAGAWASPNANLCIGGLPSSLACRAHRPPPTCSWQLVVLGRCRSAPSGLPRSSKPSTGLWTQASGQACVYVHGAVVQASHWSRSAQLFIFKHLGLIQLTTCHTLPCRHVQAAGGGAHLSALHAAAARSSLCWLGR